MDTGYCPGCDSEIRFSSPPKNGKTVVCPDCKDELVVIGTLPIELDWVYEGELEDDY